MYDMSSTMDVIIFAFIVLIVKNCLSKSLKCVVTLLLVLKTTSVPNSMANG